MAYKLLKPEIVSIRGSIWGTIKTRWQFWSFFVFATVSSGVLWIWFSDARIGVFDLDFIPFALVLAYIASIIFELQEVQNRVTVSFWKKFAEINGWRYQDSSNPNKESGIMFQQGHTRTISRYIEGAIESRQFRMFNYSFVVGGDESQRGYAYTVFAFKFNGTFPHIYLNNKHNSYSIKIGEKVPLPSEFEKQFFLFAPRKYETEALEIFTPDVLTKLLDKEFSHDVEFVGQEVIIFVDRITNKFEKFEKEFNMALELEDLLSERLDRFKFHKIGDMPHTLK